MSQLKALKAGTTLSDVAVLLDIKPGMLSYQLYKVHKTFWYTKFEISKKNGGKREIWAPSKNLKLIQHRLAVLLENCSAEINAAHGHIEDAEHRGIAHGFKKHHTIMTNGREHVARRYVFNVDLHDFFGTINFGRVRGFFIKEKNFALQPAVATVLAQIACFDNQLPQGSPCSPIISNLIAHSLDIRLADLARRTGCTYSRYADDLTFSSNKPVFPSRVAENAAANPHVWVAGSAFTTLVGKAGFTFNDKKTRMQYCDSRQEVTGLTVNRKVNATAAYRYTVRAMVQSLMKTGAFAFVERHDDGKGGTKVVKTVGRNEQLLGMLAFIDQVDRFNEKLCILNGRAPPETPGRQQLFRRFLYFDMFYAPDMPVVVCEGKTDNVYIRHAIKSLGAAYPTLLGSAPPKLGIRLLKYADRRTSEITELTGGVGGICSLIKHYRSDLALKFKASPPRHPVVLLIDGDSGANSVYGAIAGITKRPKATGKDPFIHVIGNLYVVATPLGPKGEPTKIEDFFDAKTLAETLNGKKFDPGKKADPATTYGKAPFARDVVAKKADTIDFRNFKVILDRIAASIADYAKKHPGGTTPAKP